MQLIRGQHNLRPRHRGCVATIGNFDGVHLGHQSVLGQLAESSPTALALIKQQLYELDGRDFDAGVALGARVNATARSTDDFKQAVQRFFDKQ